MSGLKSIYAMIGHDSVRDIHEHVYLKDAVDQKIKELEAKVAELEKDKEMLDYLLKYKHDFWMHEGMWRFEFDFQEESFVHETKKGCVDQAIETMKGIKP